MSLPEVKTIRERIESIPRIDFRSCLMTAYLYAGRISEVIGKSSIADNTTARGPKGTDVELDEYRSGELKEPCVVFTVRTAKRQGKERKIALPVNYEPWAESLFQYFKDHGPNLVFPFTRQAVGLYVRNNEVFEGLSYPIETYQIWKNGQIIRKVDGHKRPFNIHALRHLRATELVEFYGFGGRDLATYGGWTFRSFGYPAAADRYLSLGWHGYFHRLLKRR